MAERNVDVDVDVVVVWLQEVYILGAIYMDLLIMVMNVIMWVRISLFSSCDKPTGPKH